MTLTSRPTLTPYGELSDVLAAATIGGARLLSDVIGSLTPGKAADVVVMRPSRPVTTVEQAFGQVLWMGEASRQESVLFDRQEMLTRRKA